MRSLLISTDLIRRADGTLTPTEINTNSSSEIRPNKKEIGGHVFIENWGDYFDHVEFHNFLQDNNISKLTLINNTGGITPVIESFSEFYNYEYTFVQVTANSITVPFIEDADDTLIIRVSYDTSALVDDLYARDMFEFHNLIKDETFASPVTFNTGEETNIDTITFEPSIDGVVPNYLIKPRVPGYEKGIYPKVYRLDTTEELETLKLSIGENEFIQKYEYNEEFGTVDNRVSFIRSFDLIYGSNLDVQHLMTYKSINGVATTNTALQYDNELDENKRLNRLAAAKWHPSYVLSNSQQYHFDETDKILMPDSTTKLATELVNGDLVLGINFNEEITNFKSYPVESLETFTTGSAPITVLEPNPFDCIFINITAVDENQTEYNWYDGVDNTYLIQKQGSDNAQYLSDSSGFIEVGDSVFVFSKSSNSVKSLTITNVFFDIKPIVTYKISLVDEFREFLIELDEDISLIQHNFQCDANCGAWYFCASPNKCDLCNKQSFGCPVCTVPGSAYGCNSDRRLKENINLIGVSEKGINIYQFNYIGKEGLYEGVIAQELLDTEFESALLIGDDGMYAVDYSKLDVEFKQIN
jgi:hypothetical protein